MRERLKLEMVEARDSGLVHEAMFAELAPNGAISEYVDQLGDTFGTVVDLAFKATECDVENLEGFVSLFGSESPVIRYWASQGVLLLGEKGAVAKPELVELLKDESSAVRIGVARALFGLGEEDVASSALIAEISKKADQYAHLYAINTINECGLRDRISDEWIKGALKIKGNKSYVKRMAAELKKERE